MIIFYGLNAVVLLTSAYIVEFDRDEARSLFGILLIIGIGNVALAISAWRNGA